VISSTLALRLGAVAISLIIFIIDSLSTLDIAIAVLYVVVILISVNIFSRRGVLAVSLSCIVLTLAAFIMSHGTQFVTPAFGRCLVSLAAIGITSLLALRNKSATDELREQVRLLAQTHDAIIVRDMQGLVTTWSPGAEALYGWRREQMLGRDCNALLKTQFPDSLEQAMRALLDTDNWEGELIESRLDGSQVIVASRCSLLRDKNLQPVAILATHNDITERKRAEEALHRSQTELAHVTRVTTLGELAASIAHEVNQPLAAITTNGAASLRWLNREVPDIGEVRSGIERMLSETHRASEVIRRIRALSRKTDIPRTPLDLREVIEESVGLVQRELQRHRIILALALEPAIPLVAGDRVQLQQVIINLLVNGVQAMASVGGRKRVLRVRLQLSAPQDVLLEVEDSGPGISSENMPSLFNPFFTTKPEGMGMGLSICRSIIESHGGRIWATSHVGEGATLHFLLPATEQLPV